MFADFEPKLSEASHGAEVLFLANIQPDLQRAVREQCTATRFAALDSMNLWIETARDSLIQTIAGVDCVMLNDSELRELTREPNVIRAARQVQAWGPSAVVAKQGEYGAAMLTDDGFFALPAFPLETWSTRPGRATASPGASWATSPRIPTVPVGHELLRQAMAYGTALASFNVEAFGIERVARLTSEEISERVAELRRVTHFDERPIALRR